MCNLFYPDRITQRFKVSEFKGLKENVSNQLTVHGCFISISFQVGRMEEVEHFADWLDSLPHPIKIVIAGSDF